MTEDQDDPQPDRPHRFGCFIIPAKARVSFADARLAQDDPEDGGRGGDAEAFPLTFLKPFCARPATEL